MDGLRRGAQNVNNKGGGGEKGRGFFARWKPPYMAEGLKKYLAAPPNEEARMGVSEPIVLIKGEYQDLYARDENGNPIVPPPVIEGYRFRAHTFNVFVAPQKQGQKGYNQFRDIVCSAGPEPHAPQNCVGCYQNDHGMDGKPRDQWAFEIVHLGWYHESPLVKDGQVQTRRGSNEPILVKNECDQQKKENQIRGRAFQAGDRNWKEPYACEGCKGNHPWAYGHHRTIQVGKKHLNNLLDVNDKVGEKCASCATNILRIAFDCAHCGEELLDVASAGWTNQQLDQYSKMHQSCTKCGHQNFPVPAYSCGFNENFQRIAQECDNPTRMSVWDCVLWIQREGESTESELVVTRIDPISTFATPDGRPLSEHINEITKNRFNLLEMYKPDSLDDQAKRLMIQGNPFAAPQQQYSQYPGAPQQGGYGPPQGGGYQPQGGPQQPTFPNMGGRSGGPNYGK